MTANWQHLTEGLLVQVVTRSELVRILVELATGSDLYVYLRDDEVACYLRLSYSCIVGLLSVVTALLLLLLIVISFLLYET